jgi:hypothetical protein
MRERAVKHFGQILFLSAMLGLGVAPAAVAQAPSEQAPVPTSRINLTSDDRHVIKEIVLKDMKVDSAPEQITLEEGAVTPASVQLRAFPNDITSKVPQIKSHQFFVKDGRIAIVSPADKKIVEVIE